jgi:hypothetical protein
MVPLVDTLFRCTSISESEIFALNGLRVRGVATTTVNTILLSSFKCHKLNDHQLKAGGFKSFRRT